MLRNVTLTLLASTLLLMGEGAPAGAQTQQQAPRVVSGTYDSYYRDKDQNNQLFKSPRTVQIQALSLGGLRITSYRNGELQGTQLLIPKCEVRYDGVNASYYQNFETVPAKKGTPVEQIQFVFRINDPTGDYDVYYKQPDGTSLSEILYRRR